MLRLLALALDLPAGFFEERFSRPVANIRAVHYIAGQPSNAEQGIFGVGAAISSPSIPKLPESRQKQKDSIIGRSPEAAQEPAWAV